MDTPRALCWRVSLPRLRNQTGSFFPLSLHGLLALLAGGCHGHGFAIRHGAFSRRICMDTLRALCWQVSLPRLRNQTPVEFVWTLLALFAGGCGCHGFAIRQGAFSRLIFMDIPRALCWRVSLPRLRNQTGSLLPLNLHGHAGGCHCHGFAIGQGAFFPLNLHGHSSRSSLAGVIAMASQSDRELFSVEFAWTLLALFAGGVPLSRLRSQTGSLFPLNLHGHSSRSLLAGVIATA